MGPGGPYRALGYVPEIVLDPTGRESISARHAWSSERADEIAFYCAGQR